MKKFIIIVTCCIGFSSCSNYLDIVPDNVATIEYAFRNKQSAFKYLTGCYSYIPITGNPTREPGVSGGDELWSYFNNGNGVGGYMIARGNQNSSNPYYNYWDGLNGTTVKDLFEGIRLCNILLENVDRVSDLDEMERKRWAAEGLFLKAYYCFYLFRNYGPIPLIKENLPIDTPTEQMRIYRSTVDECVEYIAGLFEDAQEYLPLVIVNQGAEMGRATKPAALALKAKLLVYAASPLFNGDPDFAELEDNRGVRLFPQTRDPNKWKIAADACLRAIEVCEEAGMKLFTFTGRVADEMSDALRTEMSIRESMCARWNDELIWGVTTTNSPEMMRVYQARISSTYRTLNCQLWVPPMNIAEQFYTKNGVPMLEDRTMDLANNRYQLRTAVTEEKAYIKPGHITAEMHYDREPRFYASIAFDGSAWLGDGKTKDSDLWYIAGKAGQDAGVLTATNYSETGYYVKKPISYMNNYNPSWGGYVTVQYPFPVMRLADLYLLYAEALNEAQDTPSEDVFKYIDMVRERAGLKGVKESWTNYSNIPDKFATQRGMREIIQHERMLELVFESQRFWDIRRWKRLEEFMNEPVRGWNYIGEDANSYYVVTNYYKRTFSRRDYFFPIRDESLRENPNLVQNPGWE